MLHGQLHVDWWVVWVNTALNVLMVVVAVANWRNMRRCRNVAEDMRQLADEVRVYIGWWEVNFIPNGWQPKNILQQPEGPRGQPT